MSDTPLDFSDLDESQDSPELAAYKKRVAEYAKKHSKDYHCGSYKGHLKALGITDEVDKVKIDIQTAQGFVFEVKIDPALLRGKTADEQKQALAAAVGAISLSGSGAMGKWLLTGEQITSMTREVKPATAVKADADDDENWYYCSVEGRVLHWFADGLDTRNSIYGYYTACGNYVNRGSATKDSTRGEGRRCQKCATRSATAAAMADDEDSE